MLGKTTYDFSGVSALVTGSTRGIGNGIATALSEADANVAINSNQPEEVDRTVEELQATASGKIVGVPGDVGVPDDLERIVDETVENFGEVDLLVNNAAVWPSGWPQEKSLFNADLEDWNRTINVNTRASFYASKLIGHHMEEKNINGNIISTTSQAGDRRAGPTGLYGVSKNALTGLIWRLAYDFAPHGIRVNGISTYFTDSHELRKEARILTEESKDTSPEDLIREWSEGLPLGRIGKPEDLANAVMFLASNKAEYITGAILRVAGGGNLQGF